MSLPKRDAVRILAALPAEPPGVTAERLIAVHGVRRTAMHVGTLAWLHHNDYVARAGGGRRGDPYRYWRVEREAG